MVASAPLPPGAMDEEGMVDIALAGDVMRSIVTQLDPKASSIALGVSGCNLVARVMEIPPVPDSEVRAVLRGEMDHYRILPAGQSAFDYFRLPDVKPPDGEPAEEAPARVLLMGGEERVVASYRDLVASMGLGLVSVEPGSIAVLRAHYPLIRDREAVAVVSIASNRTDIFVLQKGEVQFYRQVDSGVADLRPPVGRSTPGTANPIALGPLSADDEETPAPRPSAPPAGGYQPFNRQAVSLLVTEIQRSIDYFLREYPIEGEAMKVRLAIDAQDAGELFPIIAQHLRSEAELTSVVDTLAVSPEALDFVAGPEGFRFTVAVGLALNGFGGEYAGAPALDLSVADRVVVEGRVTPRYLMASASAACVILLGTIIAAFIVGGAIARSERSLKQKKAELQALTAEHAAQVARLERQKRLVAEIANRNKPIKEAVEFISSAISPRACLTLINITSDGKIHLSGEAAAPRVVADMMDMLNFSPRLEPVRLDKLTRVDASLGGHELAFDLQTAFAPPGQTIKIAIGTALKGEAKP